MAKWGEGDPRWIVEERADAKNVNNWHWSEKDATQWSKDKLNSVLVGHVIENDKYRCEINELSKCEGEATANVRKAKLIFFYEWVLEGKWSGHTNGEEKKKCDGTFEILNLSEENSADEIDVSVTCQQSTDHARDVKEFMRTDGAKSIKKAISEYIKELRQEYGKNLVLPSKNGVQTTESTNDNLKAAAAAIKSGTGISSAPKPTGDTANKHKGLTKDIHITSEFFCTPLDLYKVFTTKELIQAFTRGDASSDAKKGGSFCLFGGSVTGVYDELKPGESIKMRWRKKSWPETHFSTVELTFSAKESGTDMKILHKNVPETDFDSVNNGWHGHYIEAIKITFGYGRNIM